MRSNTLALFERQRAPGIGMTACDLTELYSFLELFRRVYLGFDHEVDTLLYGIRDIFSLECFIVDLETALRELRTPRNSGRKAKYPTSDRIRVEKLFHDGHSIRDIAAVTGIPKSSVQRLLSTRNKTKLSQN